MYVDIFNTTNKYEVILSDFPWDFKTYSQAGEGRNANQHYSSTRNRLVKNFYQLNNWQHLDVLGLVGLQIPI